MPEPREPAKPDKTILKGGPGDPLPTPTEPAPQTVTVKYADKEYTVTPEVAAAWQKRDEDYKRGLSEQGAELGELRKVKARYDEIEGQLRPRADAPPDPAVQLFENPRQALADLETRVLQKATAVTAQVQAVRDFWAEFYRQHDDLQGEDTLVGAIMQRHWGELSTLKVSDAQAKIADLTRGEILRIHKKLKGGREEELPSDRAVVEGVGGPGPKRSAPGAEEGKPPTLSEVIRARRQQRLQPGAAKG